MGTQDDVVALGCADATRAKVWATSSGGSGLRSSGTFGHERAVGVASSPE